MYPNTLSSIAENLHVSTAVLAIVIVILSIWIICWKGWAMWTSARNGQKVWFIAFILVNTVGILEIIYYFLSKKDGGDNQKTN